MIEIKRRSEKEVWIAIEFRLDELSMLDDVVSRATDKGPCCEGWKSDELKAVADVIHQAWMVALEQSKRIEFAERVRRDLG